MDATINTVATALYVQTVQILDAVEYYFETEDGTERLRQTLQALQWHTMLIENMADAFADQWIDEHPAEHDGEDWPDWDEFFTTTLHARAIEKYKDVMNEITSKKVPTS